MATIALSLTFMEALDKLDKSTRKKVREFIEKFNEDPTRSGINIEKLKYCVDDKIRSVRIDKTYRGILAVQEDTYLFLWVDHHDEAYDWAARKRCDINDATGAIQLYDSKVTEISIEQIHSVSGLFDVLSDEDLLQIGVTKIAIPYIRNLKDEQEFNDSKELLPEDVFENLSYVVEGIPVEEILALIAVDSKPTTFAEALENSSHRGFYVIEGEEELKQMMDAPSEKWRVFLHPKQKEIVEKHFSGPARAMGGAGTGKTVVAMHRAKYLAEKMQNREKVLFTTFTVNLAKDIEDNLKKICSQQAMNHIEVTNIDSWMTSYFIRSGGNSEIIFDDTDERIDKMWKSAISRGDGEYYPLEFYKDEWKYVISAKDAFEFEKYLRVPREGRGTGLDRRSRMNVWKVFLEFMNIMDEKRICDIEYAYHLCTENIKEANGLYESIIVDEGQDLSPAQYRLLRAMAGVEHNNDLFIVGDSHQRIYDNNAVLSQCGINIRGRSSILRVNYRTTDEIRKYANSLLAGISFDDMDEGIANYGAETSLTHGDIPVIKGFDSTEKEAVFVKETIDSLLSSGVPQEEICIVARSRNILDSFKDTLGRNGLQLYELKNQKADDRGISGVRCATMHRVKGLEFQYVFVVALNKDTNTSYSETRFKREKCLVYVSLTRARKEAYITYTGKPSEVLNL